MRVEWTGSSSVTDYHYNSSSAIKMSDHDRTWDDSDSVALPPTPGRTLNISTTVSHRESSSSKNKAKRRLDLEDSVKSKCPNKTNKSKHRPPPLQLDALKKKPLKPFTIPKKINKRPEEPLKKEDQRPPPPKKIKTEQPTLPQPPKIKERPPVKWYKAEGEQQQVIKRIKTEEDLNVKKLKPAEEKVLAKRLKTQAWARILKKKQKLYIPHTSDPRQSEEALKAQEDEMAVDVKPIVDHCNNNDKENSSLVINVTATIMTTPIKMSDHNSIIKFMSITPQLLSPLAENPRMVK